VLYMVVLLSVAMIIDVYMLFMFMIVLLVGMVFWRLC